MMKLDEVTILRRALKSVSEANAGWLNNKPTLSHPMERARLLTAFAILRKRAVRPFGPDVIAILEEYGWPSDVAEEAAALAESTKNPMKLWRWGNDVVDRWFEGDV